MEYLFRCISTSNIAASLRYQRTLVRRKCSAIAKQIMVAIVNSKAITSTLSISLLDTTIYVAQKASTKTIPEPKSCLIRLARALSHEPSACLLYTSDAADEEDSVDLGGRRIIKKKKKKKKK